MKYLILIYNNPTVWDDLSDDQRVTYGRGHGLLTEDLTASGELIVSEALADPSLGKRVTVRDGKTMTSDGPFAEMKEHLAGFYLIDCESIERAIEHAARLPGAAYGLVEVRPVMEVRVWMEM